jgi:hypothetical protein
MEVESFSASHDSEGTAGMDQLLGTGPQMAEKT